MIKRIVSYVKSFAKKSKSLFAKKGYAFSETQLRDLSRWEQFTSKDADKLEEFLEGLKGVRAAYKDLNTSFLINTLNNKKQAEGWIYRGEGFTLGIVMSFKEYLQRYRLLFTYASGEVDLPTICKLMTAKMDEYCQRVGNGKLGWDVKMAKDGIGLYSAVSKDTVPVTVSDIKTFTIVSESPTDVYIRYDPK